MFSKLFIFCHNPFRFGIVELLEISFYSHTTTYYSNHPNLKLGIKSLFSFIIGEIIFLCKKKDYEISQLEYIHIVFNHRDYYFVNLDRSFK